MNQIRLITRADDAGSNSTVNRAILKTCDQGIIRNVSLMATCGAIEEAAKLFRRRSDICFGVHLTLNAEWDRVRWGSVLPPDKVPSLIDEEGYLHRTPDAMRLAGACLDEVFDEMQAQLDRLRKMGFLIRYADEHMFFGRVFDKYDERFDQWCAREGIVNFRRYYRKLQIMEKGLDPVRALMESLDKAESGIYTLITHPAFDNLEMRLLGHKGLEGAQIAANRDSDTRMLTSSKLVDYCKLRQITFLRYDEV